MIYVIIIDGKSINVVSPGISWYVMIACMGKIEKAVAADPATLGVSSRELKVFGVGLSRTGTRSLTTALRVLGFDTAHYPVDQATLDTLVRGDARFPLLDSRDGITDITVAPYYEDLDRAFPKSRFVLTVRDEESWLRSCRFHWARPVAGKGGEGSTPGFTKRSSGSCAPRCTRATSSTRIGSAASTAAMTLS
jgi:Sulfotransferase domain